MMYNLEVMLETIVYTIERKRLWRKDSTVKLQLSPALDVV
jgi:hypothetical protein